MGSRLLEEVRRFIPRLSSGLHKGEAGKIAIVGGSKEYTGAPFFAAMAALRTGADLLHIFCEESAAAAIKSYSPELIVHPYLTNSKFHVFQDSEEEEEETLRIVESVTSWFHKFDVIVMGCGLSRDPFLLQCVRGILRKAREKNLPIVLDADALCLVQQEPDLVRGYSKAVLTPNVIEMSRLCHALDIPLDRGARSITKDKPSEARETGMGGLDPISLTAMTLCQQLGHVTVLEKGEMDIITDGHEVVYCSEQGGFRRCGGQGDILAGVLATFLAWSKRCEEGKVRDIHSDHSLPEDTGTLSKSVGIDPSGSSSEHKTFLPPTNPALLAGYAACHFVRTASRVTFERHGRSMIASDMFSTMHTVFDQLFPGL